MVLGISTLVCKCNVIGSTLLYFMSVRQSLFTEIKLDTLRLLQGGWLYEVILQCRKMLIAAYIWNLGEL